MIWAGHLVRLEEGRSTFEILTHIGKRPLGRPRSRWEDSIRINLTEIDNTGNWIDSAQDRDYFRATVNAALNLRVFISHGVS